MANENGAEDILAKYWFGGGDDVTPAPNAGNDTDGDNANDILGKYGFGNGAVNADMPDPRKLSFVERHGLSAQQDTGFSPSEAYDSSLMQNLADVSYNVTPFTRTVASANEGAVRDALTQVAQTGKLPAIDIITDLKGNGGLQTAEKEWLDTEGKKYDLYKRALNGDNDVDYSPIYAKKFNANTGRYEIEKDESGAPLLDPKYDGGDEAKESARAGYMKQFATEWLRGTEQGKKMASYELKNDTAEWYSRIGADATQSLGFVAELVMGGGAASGIMGAGMLGKTMQGIATASKLGAKLGFKKWAANEMVGIMLPSIATATARFNQLTADDVIVKDDGSIAFKSGDNSALAFAKATSGAVVENAIDVMLGEAVGKLIGKVGIAIGDTKFAKKLFSQSPKWAQAFMSKMRNAWFDTLRICKKIQDVTKINNPLGEFAEEYSQGFMDNVVGLDSKSSVGRDSISDFSKRFFSWDDGLKDLTLGIIGQTLLMAGSAHVHNRARINVASFDHRITGALKEKGFSSWEQFMMGANKRLAAGTLANTQRQYDTSGKAYSIDNTILRDGEFGTSLREIFRLCGISNKRIDSMTDIEKGAALDVINEILTNPYGAIGVMNDMNKGMRKILNMIGMRAALDGNWNNVESALKRESRTRWEGTVDSNGNVNWQTDDSGRTYVEDAATGARIYRTESKNDDGTTEYGYTAFHPELGEAQIAPTVSDALNWASDMDKVAQERNEIRQKKKQYVGNFVQRIMPERTAKDGTKYGANVVAANNADDALLAKAVPEADKELLAGLTQEEKLNEAFTSTRTGTVYIFVDNVDSVDKMMYTIAHELGNHAALGAWADDKAEKNAAKDGKELSPQDKRNEKDSLLSAIVNAVYPNSRTANEERAEDERNERKGEYNAEGIAREEALAYGNEMRMPDANVLRRAVTAVKMYMNEKFGGNFKLTDDDYNAIATAGLNKIKQAIGIVKTEAQRAQYGESTLTKPMRPNTNGSAVNDAVANAEEGSRWANDAEGIAEKERVARELEQGEAGTKDRESREQEEDRAQETKAQESEKQEDGEESVQEQAKEQESEPKKENVSVEKEQADVESDGEDGAKTEDEVVDGKQAEEPKKKTLIPKAKKVEEPKSKRDIVNAELKKIFSSKVKAERNLVNRIYEKATDEEIDKIVNEIESVKNGNTRYVSEMAKHVNDIIKSRNLRFENRSPAQRAVLEAGKKRFKEKAREDSYRYHKFIEENMPHSVLFFLETISHFDKPPMKHVYERVHDRVKTWLYDDEAIGDTLDIFFDGVKSSGKKRWERILFGKNATIKKRSNRNGNDVVMGMLQEFLGKPDLTFDDALSMLIEEVDTWERYVSNGYLTDMEVHEKEEWEEWEQEENRLKKLEEAESAALAEAQEAWGNAVGVRADGTPVMSVDDLKVGDGIEIEDYSSFEPKTVYTLIRREGDLIYFRDKYQDDNPFYENKDEAFRWNAEKGEWEHVENKQEGAENDAVRNVEGKDEQDSGVAEQARRESEVGNARGAEGKDGRNRSDAEASSADTEGEVEVISITDDKYDDTFVEGRKFADNISRRVMEQRMIDTKSVMNGHRKNSEWVKSNLLENETWDRVVAMPSVQKYIGMYKSGTLAPPATVIIMDDGNLRSLNRRRVVAAIEAGIKKIPANVETGEKISIPNESSKSIGDAADQSKFRRANGISDETYRKLGPVFETLQTISQSNDSPDVKWRRVKDAGLSLGTMDEHIASIRADKFADGDTRAEVKEHGKWRSTTGTTDESQRAEQVRILSDAISSASIRWTRRSKSNDDTITFLGLRVSKKLLQDVDTRSKEREKDPEWKANYDRLEKDVLSSLKNYGDVMAFAPDESASFLKYNSSYPQASVDFIDICIKREMQLRVLTDILRKHPNFEFDKIDLAIIAEELKKAPKTIRGKIQTACVGCFIEHNRQQLSKVCRQFIDAMKGNYSDELNVNQRAFMDALHKHLGNKLKAIGKKTTIFDIAVPDGSGPYNNKYRINFDYRTGANKDNVRHFSSIYECFEKFNDCRGQQRQLLFGHPTEYRGELKLGNRVPFGSKGGTRIIDKNYVRDVNDLGGIRLWSSSDFDAKFLGSLVRILKDAGELGLHAQSYSKRSDYAWLMRNTGVKILLSGEPLGSGYHECRKDEQYAVPITENGKTKYYKLDFDPIEGFDVDGQNAFDPSEHPNIGINIIGISVKHMMVAQGDPRIVQIIPMHGTMTPEMQKMAELHGWTMPGIDSEWIIGENGRPKMMGHINFYREVITPMLNSGEKITERKFVEKFLDVCNSRGLRPRCPYGLKKVGDWYAYKPGYSKYLADGKFFEYRTDGSVQFGTFYPQEVVRPDIKPNEASRVVAYRAKEIRVRNNLQLGGVAKNAEDRMIERTDRTGEIKWRRKSSALASNGIYMGSFFSGAGTIEDGLRGAIKSVFGVEYDKDIAEQYRKSHGDQIINADIRDVDIDKLGKVNYFHASPACHHFSATGDRTEQPLDILTAEKTAEVIRRKHPAIVTVENAPAYRNSKSVERIRKALRDGGYNFDEGVYNASDFGGTMERKRYILRAVRNGELPEVAKTAPAPWGSRITRAEMDALKDGELRQFQKDALAKDGIDDKHPPKEPVLIFGGGKAGDRLARWSYASELARSIVASPKGSQDYIVLPNGKVKEVNGRVLAKLMGLSSEFYVPEDYKLARQVIGNGMSGDMVRGVIKPLFEGRENEARFRRGKVITPEEDAKYLDAVKRGDMETAQRMVREAAAKNTSLLHIKNNKTGEFIKPPKMLAHEVRSMPKEFAKEIGEWDVVSKSPYSNSFYNSNDISWDGKPDGSLRVADHWNFTTFLDQTRHCKTDIPVKNTEEWALGRWNANKGEYEIIKKLPSLGEFTGAVRKVRGFLGMMEVGGMKAPDTNTTKQYIEARKLANENTTPYSNNPDIYLDTETGNIKSADPVTYDDDGNVIPLSERFDEEKDDIRWRSSLDGTEHRWNGYDGYSMSNNARAAYASGEKPKSKWTKGDIIDAIAEIDNDKAALAKIIPVSVLKLMALERSSWHHSSSWYNTTDFYRVSEDFVKDLTTERAKELANWEVSKDEEAVLYKGDFDYIIWEGTKKHPKANKQHLENVNIEERGSFYYVTDDYGKLIIKKKIGSNGTRAVNYDTKRKMEEAKRITGEKMRTYSTDQAKEFLGLKDVGGVYSFNHNDFDVSMDGNVYVKGRKPSRDDYNLGLQNFLNKGEQRAVKNENGGYYIETWDGDKWIPESNGNDIRFRRSDIYTGSAADYDKPSLMKIGTGEGSHVYGWGLYGSTVRGVAEEYAVGGPSDHAIVMVDGKEWKPSKEASVGKKTAYEQLDDLINSPDEIAAYCESMDERRYKDAAKFIRSHKIEIRDPHSYLYSQTFFTNRADGDDSHLLNWYEPVSAGNMMRIFSKAKAENIAPFNSKGFNAYEYAKSGRTGESVYKQLSNMLGSPKAASEFLARADIDGIKYPVGSYGKVVKDGDKVGWNYVSFRDDNISVDHKWRDGEQLFRRSYTPNQVAQLLADKRIRSTTDAQRGIKYGVNNEALLAAEKLARQLSQQGSISPEIKALAEATKKGGLIDRSKGILSALISRQNISQWRERLQDSLISLNEMENKLGISKADSPYYQFDRNYGIVADKVRALDREIIVPLAEELRNNNIGIADFQVLLQALHGGERNRMIAERSPYVLKALDNEDSIKIVNDILLGNRELDDKALDDISTALGWVDKDGKFTKERKLLERDLAGSGATTAYWNKQIADFKKSGLFDKAEKAVSLVRKLTKRNRDILVETGRLSKKQADKWEELSPNYVPLRSDMEMDDNIWSKWLLGGAIGDKSSGGKRYSEGEYNHAYGRGTLADNPLEFAIQQYHDSLHRAYDNVARTRLANIVRDNPNLGKVFRYEADMTDKKREKYAKSIAIIKNMVKAGTATEDDIAKMRWYQEAFNAEKAIPMVKVLGSNGIVYEVPNIAGLEGNRNNHTGIIAFKENGELKFIKLGGFEQGDISGDHENGIPPNTDLLDDVTARRIATAVKKQNMAELNGFGNALRKATGVFSALRTAYSPTFLVSNFGADNTQALRNIYSTFGIKGAIQFEKYAYNALKAAQSVLSGEYGDNKIQQYANEWANNGGRIGGMASSSIADLTEDIKRTIRKIGSKHGKFADIHSVRDVVQWANDRKDDFMDLAEKWNSVVEMSTRIASYATARDMGYSVADAVSYSRDITVNFNRKGTLTPWLNAIYAFSNASFQDLHRSLIAFSEGRVGTGTAILAGRGAKMFLGLSLMGFIASMFGYWQDDPEDEEEGNPQWKYVKDWQKQNVMGIRIGEKTYGVPIRGISRIPYYLGHQVWEMMSGRKNVFKAAFDTAMLAADSSTDFTGQASSPLMTAVPSVMRDPIDIFVGNKTFTGRNRYREPLPGQEETAVRSEMGRGDTSDAAKAIAKALNRITFGDSSKRGLIDVQPEKISGVFEWIFGSAGNDVANALGTVKDIATLNIQNRPVKNVPYLSRFVRKIDENSADFYSARQKYEQAKRHYTGMNDIGDTDAMAEDVARHPWLATRGRGAKWGQELKDLDNGIKKLLKIEKSASKDDYDAIHALRLKAQYQFMRRLETPPQDDAVGVEKEKAHAKTIEPLLRSAKRAEKNEKREKERRRRALGM